MITIHSTAMYTATTNIFALLLQSENALYFLSSQNRSLKDVYAIWHEARAAICLKIVFYASATHITIIIVYIAMYADFYHA